MKKILLLGLLFGGAGTAGYFLLRKSKKDLKRDVNDTLPARDKHSMDSALDKMTRQELLDVRKFMSLPLAENTPKEVADKMIGPELKARIIKISNKYNIFT